MNISQLTPAMSLFLQNIYEFYNNSKADESKYHTLEVCIDRLELIELADVHEHARLLVTDRKLFQSLLPHMGHPEYFKLRAMLMEVIDAARMFINPIYTQK